MHFEPELFQNYRERRGVRLGEHLQHFEEIGSTNDEALTQAKLGAPHGSVYIADSQSRGRGRHGKTWSARRGENLLVSILLRPNLKPSTASSFTLGVGLAVRDAIAPHLTQPVQVKWPNDIWINTQKLGGILVESNLVGSKLDHLVVGIGLNVHTLTFPEELKASATSIALCLHAEAHTSLSEAPLPAKAQTPAEAAPSNRQAEPSELASRASPPSREIILVDILYQLQRRLAEFERAGLSPMVDELRSADALLGRELQVEQLRGVARGIDQAGALLVEDNQGVLQRVLHGSVSLV